jgi:hypothetical protein
MSLDETAAPTVALPKLDNVNRTGFFTRNGCQPTEPGGHIAYCPVVSLKANTGDNAAEQSSHTACTGP